MLLTKVPRLNSIHTSQTSNTRTSQNIAAFQLIHFKQRIWKWCRWRLAWWQKWEPNLYTRNYTTMFPCARFEVHTEQHKPLIHSVGVEDVW